MRAMILGVGDAQTDALRFLKEKGWWVMACAHQAQGRGLQWVDRFEMIDIADHERLTAVAKREGIDLVYSVGSDLALPSVEAVARRLGLPSFFDSETVSILQNKARLREFLSGHQLSRFRYKTLNRISGAEGWSLYPSVLKPVDGQGQRGVFRVDSAQDLEKCFSESIHHSRQGLCLLEEFLEGPEVSVNLLLSEGRIVFRSVADRLIFEGSGTGIPRGHLLPSQFCVGDVWAETKRLTEECVRLLRIENGPVYFQIKLTPRGPEVIEVTPRLDGCHLWRLIRAAGGPDLLAGSLEMLAEGAFSQKQKESPLSKSYLGFFLDRPGGVFIEKNHSPPSPFRHVEYYYNDGDTVRPVNGIMEKVGYYLQGGA